MENNNCDRHIYLYAKGHYLVKNLVEDLRLICAERCGNYNTKYGNIYNLEEVEKCKVSVKDTVLVMTYIIYPYIQKTGLGVFLEFINDIHPRNTWKVGYMNKQSDIAGNKEKDDYSDYDYFTAILYKYCSILRNLTIQEIKEVGKCELGEPDYDLFPMFKKEQEISV